MITNQYIIMPAALTPESRTAHLKALSADDLQGAGSPSEPNMHYWESLLTIAL